jgi:hypothetical protein
MVLVIVYFSYLSNFRVFSARHLREEIRTGRQTRIRKFPVEVGKSTSEKKAIKAKAAGAHKI